MRLSSPTGQTPRPRSRASLGSALLRRVDVRALCLALSAVLPWPLAAIATSGPGPVQFVLCGSISAAALSLLIRMLRPVRRAADAIRLYVGSEPDEGIDGTTLNDAAAIAFGISHLHRRLEALRHRWTGRHGLTALPVRETLLAAIEVDLRAQVQGAMVGAIRFADYGRLAVFDPAGAELALAAFAERLAATIAPGRPIAHVDRDSFALWFGGADARAARLELQAIGYAMGAEIEVGTLRLSPEIEVGEAIYPADGADAAALLNHALVSLAKPGASGFEKDAPGRSADAARERFALEQELRHAIERQQLELVFQPIVDLGRGPIGAEALLRWQHPELGRISPATFIPILEDADLIGEIGRWTLNAACREARRWQQCGLGGLRVAVNLSAAQLRDPSLLPMIRRTLERHRLSPAALELELTETAAAQDSIRTRDLFGALRALGVSIAIDDFGSGYSSLSYLKNLPFDKLKIDREFVVDIHLRKDSQAICRSLVALTRGLGLRLLAEGVESWDEVAVLEQMGCRTFQGFLFSEPLDSDQFAALVADPQWLGMLCMQRVQEQAEGRLTA